MAWSRQFRWKLPVLSIFVAGIVLSPVGLPRAHGGAHGAPYGIARVPVIPVPVDERGVPDPQSWPDQKAYVRRIDRHLSRFATDCVPWAGGRTALLRYRDGGSVADTVKLIVPEPDDAGDQVGITAYYFYHGEPIATASRGPGHRSFRRLDWSGRPVGSKGVDARAKRFAMAQRLRAIMKAFPAVGTDPLAVFRAGPWRRICQKMRRQRAFLKG